MPANASTFKSRLCEPDWPGFDFVFFDCDSTLSSIEGIDELARLKGKFAEVKRLTDAAMDGEIHLQNVYDRRLQMLAPTRAEIRDLERHYRETLVPDAQAAIEALKYAGKELFIVSGGLLAAVRPFGEWLGIPRQNIRAVAINFNTLSGRWWDYQADRWGPAPDAEYLAAEESPLVQSEGKADVVRELLQERPPGRAMLVGDGMSDLAAQQALELVVGFGGVITRPSVAQAAKVFIKCNSLAPVVPLALSSRNMGILQGTLYERILVKGWDLINAGEVVFR
jgi:phosphoserine phosphatase